MRKVCKLEIIIIIIINTVLRFVMILIIITSKCSVKDF